MDTAHELFAGLRFDRKRFRKDMSMFQKDHSAEDRPPLTPPTPDEAASTSGRVQPKQTEQERIGLLRKQFNIHVSTQRAPAPLQSFEELRTRYQCRPRILSLLAGMGLSDPTPIQRQAIPCLLQGLECFACAPTGSGKTLAYALPIIISLKSGDCVGVRALVLCPTRELAAQIGREFKRLLPGSRLRVRVLTKAAARCNDLLTHPGCDILVSTPLRLAALLRDTHKIDLSRVQHLVLDEADKLFEMGFVDQIDRVVAACTSPTLFRSLFSATLPETVEQLARTVMHDPCRIVVGERNSATESVRQRLLFVGSEEGKALAMRQLLKEGIRPPVLVFVQSKERAQQVYGDLLGEGLNVGVIHADRTQSQRDAAVDEFRSGKVWLLITTDLLGRGMDFKGVNMVINYDFPPSTSSYIHRVGRTGRAGRQGEAVTLYTEDDKDALRGVAHLAAASGSEVPDWMLSLPKTRKRKWGPHNPDAKQPKSAEGVGVSTSRRKGPVEKDQKRKRGQISSGASQSARAAETSVRSKGPIGRGLKKQTRGSQISDTTTKTQRPNGALKGGRQLAKAASVRRSSERQQ